MATAVYTGKLVDIGVNALGAWKPRLTVRPEIEARRAGVIVSSKRIAVPVSNSDGAFSMTLIPSSELVGIDGRIGVKYVLEVALFEDTLDGSSWAPVNDAWKFTALPGGGDVAGMGDGPSIALYIGPPWPATAKPGTYFDTVTGDLGYYAIEVN